MQTHVERIRLASEIGEMTEGRQMNPYREPAICAECNGLGWIACHCFLPGHWFRCCDCNTARVIALPAFDVPDIANFRERKTP